MTPRVALVLLAVAVTLSTGCGGNRQGGGRSRLSVYSHFAGVRVPPGSDAADFSLRDQDGRLVRLSAQRGRLVLLAFLYTHCVDFCPFVAVDLNAAVRSLGHQASSVRILAVSVDPRYDTLAAVRRYVREHRLIPQFRWLRGSRAELAPIWQAYNVLVEQRSPELVAHSAQMLLIDAHGEPVVAYPTTVSSSAVAHDLRLLIRGQGALLSSQTETVGEPR